MAPSPHRPTTFESPGSNSNASSKCDPKFDLSDITHSLAISKKLIERIDDVINVSNPEVCALSIGSGLGLI